MGGHDRLPITYPMDRLRNSMTGLFKTDGYFFPVKRIMQA